MQELPTSLSFHHEESVLDEKENTTEKGSDFCEVAITLKSEDQKLVCRYPEYRLLSCSKDCPVLQELVSKSIKAFAGTPQDISIKIKVEW